MAEIRRVLAAAGATAIRVSASESERLLFWSGRKAAFPAVGRIAADYYLHGRHDSARARCRRCSRASPRSAKEFGLACANVFHAGDGNLHPLIMFDANVADEAQRAEAFGAAILELCIEVGGTITGEHGVGVEKIRGMCSQFRPGELDALPRRQGGVRRPWPAQPRQGGADAAPLRRVRPDARPPRRAAASRVAAVLRPRDDSTHAAVRGTRGPMPGPSPISSPG